MYRRRIPTTTTPSPPTGPPSSSPPPADGSPTTTAASGPGCDQTNSNPSIPAEREEPSEESEDEGFTPTFRNWGVLW